MWIYCDYCAQSDVQDGVFCVPDTASRCPECGRPETQEGIIRSPLTPEAVEAAEGRAE